MNTDPHYSGQDSKAFGVKVLVLSSLFFFIVLEALSREFRESLPMELLYAGDLVLMTDMELLVEKIQKREGTLKKTYASQRGYEM